VIVAVPADTPVTTPVVAFTVAIAVFDELHVPPVCVELNVVVELTQMFCVPDNVPATGAAVTVTVRVAVAFEHPPVPATVYVIVAVPAATPVTTPVVAFTVAIPVFDELHVPPVCVELNVVVELTQMFWVPDNVPATGAAVTVTVRVAVAFEHPPVPATVYVIVAVPADTPVTTPVVAFTVAIPVFDELHVPPVCVELNVVVELTQMFWVPDNVPATGAAVTVTVRVAVAFEHPPVPATVYVIVAVPADTPVTTPVVAFTVAIPVFDELHVPPVCVELNVVVELTQMFCVPDNVPATGAAVTVTVRVAVAFEHPPVPATVYVIVAVPAATPVTTPVVAFTVAIPVFDELHVPPVCVELNVVVALTQMFCVPVNVPATGGAVTVI